ncbi:hypothetical protein [Abyssisolibacter fermentans]|nr:hypothetical protein [Abyssisolibacter fermentans]
MIKLPVEFTSKETSDTSLVNLVVGTFILAVVCGFEIKLKPISN